MSEKEKVLLPGVEVIEDEEDNRLEGGGWVRGQEDMKIKGNKYKNAKKNNG